MERKRGVSSKWGKARSHRDLLQTSEVAIEANRQIAGERKGCRYFGVGSLAAWRLKKAKRPSPNPTRGADAETCELMKLQSCSH